MRDTGQLAETAGAAVIWKGAQLGATRLISLARLLILTRLLLPEDFGLLAIGMGVVHAVLAVTDLGLVPALVQYEEADEVHYHAAWTAGLTRSLLLAVLIVLGAPLIATAYAEPRAAAIIQVLALKPFLEALASIKVAELTRRLHFRSLAVIGITATVAEAATAIALAPSLGVWALVAGVLAGAGAHVISSYIVAPYSPRLCFSVAHARPLIRFGRWIMLSGLATAAAGLLFQIVISRTLGAASLGLYYLAIKLAFLPSHVTGEVVGAVAFPVYARLRSDARRSGRAFRAILTTMTLALTPVYALMAALAPAIVRYLMDARMVGTAPVIRVFAVIGLIGLVGDAVVPALKGLGLPSRVTALLGLQSALAIPLAWWLAKPLGLVGVALALLLATAVTQLLALYFIRRILDRPFSGLGGPVLAVATVSLLGAATLIVTLLPGLFGFLVGVALAVAVTAGLLWVCERRFRLGLLDGLVQVFPQAFGSIARG